MASGPVTAAGKHFLFLLDQGLPRRLGDAEQAVARIEAEARAQALAEVRRLDVDRLMRAMRSVALRHYPKAGSIRIAWEGVGNSGPLDIDEVAAEYDQGERVSWRDHPNGEAAEFGVRLSRPEEG